MICPKCGMYLKDGFTICPSCGAPVATTPPPSPYETAQANDAAHTAPQPPEGAATPGTTAGPTAGQAPVAASKSRVTAGVLAILLGGLGIHKFYLGYTTEGLIMLGIWLLGFLLASIPTWGVWIVGIIEGIIYLTKSDQEFYATYVAGKRVWF